MIIKKIDWDRMEKRAMEMTDAELFYAILDCVKTTENFDKMDREDGLDRAGYYRDEASIYLEERRKRSKK